MSSELTWGDTVKLKQDAPAAYAKASLGEIVGFWGIENESASAKYGEPLDTVICTVELSDGSSTEVPTKYLERVTACVG